VQIDKVFVVTASYMLSPETRKPGDSVEFRPRDLSKRMQIEIVVDSVETIEKELNLNVR
jgi:hypothetical protein